MLGVVNEPNNTPGAFVIVYVGDCPVIVAPDQENHISVALNVYVLDVL